MTRELEFNPASLQGLSPEDEAVFKNVNYVQLVLQYRWWLVAGCLAGFALGALAYMQAGPEYEATAQILVSRKDSVPIREEQRTLSDWGERSEHIALIMSPLIINRAIEIGKLKELPPFRGSDDVAQDIIDDLRVKRSSGQDRSYLNVLTITYPSKRPQDARAVLDAVVAAYDKYLEETRTEKSDEVLHVAQNALSEVEQKLRDKEQEYHEFREVAPLHWKSAIGSNATDGQNTTNVHQDRVQAAEEQRRLNLLRQAQLESRVKAIEAARTSGESPDGLELLVRRFLAQDGPAGNEFQQQQQQDIAIFENRLLPLLIEEKQLLRDYGPDHPDVKQVRQSIQTALDFYRRQGVRLPEERKHNAAIDEKTAMLDFVGLYAESLRQELAELAIRDKELAKLVADESEKAKGVARFQAKDAALNAELGRLRELWGQLVTQVNQVGVEREGNGYTMKQLAPVKEELSMKRVIKYVGGGTVLGALAVAAFCLLRELRDLRIKTISELRKAMSQPLLGTIGRFGGAVDPRVDRRTLHPALRYVLAPRSLEAESYRSLRAALNVVSGDAHARIIQFTSPETGDGKTTTVSNLAIAMAQSGKRVLLIDADLRRPSAHSLFRLPPDIGLADVLAGEIDGLNAIRETFVENLRVLPAGKSPANPAELLSSPKLTQLFNEVRDEFDLILVDSPPLLAVSDPSAISRLADGLVLVVRLGKTSLVTAARARDLLVTHNATLLGVVANATSPEDTHAYAAGEAYYEQTDAPSPAPRQRARSQEATVPAGH